MLQTATPAEPEVIYPESDGKPMADNSVQFDWIYRIYGGLATLFADRADVFVCGNQNWYPVEGHPEIVQAPDVYVVFGRPKGHRPSWKQWQENDVPMTVVFEILSPSNTPEETAGKVLFYEQYGVDEFYVYDPDNNRLEAFVRGRAALVPTRVGREHESRRLGIRFDLTGAEMVVRFPDGRPFELTQEMETRFRAALRRADDQEKRADEEKQRADDQRKRADEEKQRADDQRKRADEEKQRADDQRKRADEEKQRADDQRKRADEEKQRADDQRKRADEEKQRADDQRKRADEEKQRADDQRKRAGRLAELTQKLLQQQATAEEQKELRELMAALLKA